MNLAEMRLRRRHDLRALAREALEAGVGACDGDRSVARALPALMTEPPLAGAARVDVLAWGKAALRMARPALHLVPDAAGRLLITKNGHDDERARLDPRHVLLAGHPLPDERSVRAAEAALDLARRGDPTTPLLMLGSGGGSSLLACPPDGVSIEDLAALSRLLLRSGAGIGEMNVVRRHVSGIHGGRLAAALGERPSLSLLLSDVPGDDPSDIGSGPLAPDESTFEDALGIVARWLPPDGVPPSIRSFLERGARGDIAETPGRGSLDWSRHRSIVVASNALAVDAVRTLLRAKDFAVPGAPVVSSGRSAEDVAVDLVARALGPRPDGAGPRAVLGGGEPSVVVTGAAPGGRNQHLAALVAREIDRAATRGLLGETELVFASLASDGQDGCDDIAGAIVDAGTWSRAAEAGLDPHALLVSCRATEMLRAAGALVPGAPTGTNVMDLHLLLAAPVARGSRELRA